MANLLQGIAIASNNIIGANTTHNQVHTSKVVSIFLEFLGVIFDFGFIFNVFRHTSTNIDK
jgi:hypothetical protein